MENQPSNHKEAIEKHPRGRDLANQLLQHLNKMDRDEGSRTIAQSLLQNIERSLTNSYLLLNCIFKTDEISQMKEERDSSCPKSGNLENNCNDSAIKNRKGCYKRRRTLQSWENDTPTLIEDGHAWRKCGQKMILDGKCLRNYFRCTHKYDQGCQAIRQVQRIQESPPLCRTTYYGYHTCINCASHLRSPKGECKEEISDDHMACNGSFDSSNHRTMLSPNLQSNHNVDFPNFLRYC